MCVISYLRPPPAPSHRSWKILAGRYCGYDDGSTANDPTICRSSIIHGSMATPATVHRDQKARVVEIPVHLTVCAHRRPQPPWCVPCASPARARGACGCGTRIRAPYPKVRTHPQPPATRLPSPGIYIWQLPRLRPTAPTAACALSGRSIAFYVVFLDGLWRHAHLWRSADTAVCGSRCAVRVEARTIARRVLLPSPLC